MAGIMLVILGVTGLGSAVKYIPRPVVVGFTNGIAIIIASTQIKDLFGLKVDKVPGDFSSRIAILARNFHTLSPVATGLALLSLVIIILFMRYAKKIPGYIVALLAGTSLVVIFKLPVETIGSRFGGIPSGLPHVAVPPIRFDLLRPLISPAITVAMLGAIESLMSAVVSDRMSGSKHNPNVELVGQGVANIFSPLFGGLPATGAIARTATNIRSGAKTPVAGMIHALTLLAIILFAAPLARFIPLAVLAAILFVVSYNMGEWLEIPELLKLSPLEIGTWLVTFLLTVFADLTVAVEAGMILAALVYIHKVTETTTVSQVTEEYLKEGHAHILQHKEIPAYVAIFRIHGPFLFGATDKINDIIARIPRLPPIVILRLTQHDRARRHRPAGAGAFRGCRPSIRPRAATLRSAPAAGGNDARCRFRRARRFREYLSACTGRAGTRKEAVVVANRSGSRDKCVEGRHVGRKELTFA